MVWTCDKMDKDDLVKRMYEGGTEREEVRVRLPVVRWIKSG